MRRRTYRTGLCVLHLGVVVTLCALPLAALHAQAVEPLSSLSEGTRVRITPRSGSSSVASGGRVIGTVQQVGTDSISFLSPGGRPQTLALSQVALLEMSDGMRHYGKRGLGIGFLLGAATMTAIVLAEPLLSPKSSAVPYWGGNAGAAGGMVGGIIGLAIRREAWRPVAPAPGEMRLSVQPLLGAGQWGVGIRLNW